jgi:hypothetical protein
MIPNKEKRGAEKTISIYWFAILIIVAGAVVYMVVSVYGQPYDVRQIESDILANNIADCISEGGYLKEKVLNDASFKENFLKQCNLNFDVPDFPKSKGEYYAQVNFYDFNTGNKINFEVTDGNLNLKQFCELKGKTNPTCSQKSFYVIIDKSQQSYRIDIISIVNKADKNV